VLTRFISKIFGNAFSDILSGYRVFSRRFVKSSPTLASGFEVESELSVHALELRMPTSEINTVYKCRPEGSQSKLNTYRDGVRIFMTIVKLFEQERPLVFFSILFGILTFLSLILAYPILVYLTGLVPRLPTAVLFYLSIPAIRK